MKTYFNIKTSQRTETVDELIITDFVTHKDYKNEVKRLINEYNICGMNVYISQKPCKEWNK
jgi:hypothetical protein